MGKISTTLGTVIMFVLFCSPPTVYGQTNKDSENLRIERLIESLSSESEKLETILSRSAERQISPSPSGSARRIEKANDEPSQSRNEDLESKVQEIGSRIRLIRDIRIKSKQEASMVQTNPPNESTNEPQPPTMVNENQDFNSNPKQLVDDSPPIVSDIQPPMVQESNSQFAQPPTRVLDQVLDPYELGNSLFQLGEFDSALSNYQLVKREQLNEGDAIWLDFMIANCFRKLKKWDEAEAIYRDVANRNDNVQPIPTAQIWLEQLPQLRQLDLSTTEIDASYQALMEKAETYLK